MIPDLEAVDQAQQAGFRHLARRGSRLIGVAALAAGVQEQVHQQRQLETAGERQQPDRQVERHAIDIDPHQLPQAHIHVCHQAQRRQKMLAELAISHPRLAWLVDFEGERIDQNRATLVELDIVGAAVLERHAMLQGAFLDLQRSQGRILVLAEAPFVRDRR